MVYRLFYLLLLIGAPLQAFAQSQGMLQNPAIRECVRKFFPPDLNGLDFDAKFLSKGLYNAECTFLGLIQFFMIIAGTVCLFMFVYGGIQYFFALRHSSGDYASEGHKTFYHAAMGLLLMVMAYIIMNLVIDAFTKFTPPLP